MAHHAAAYPTEEQYKQWKEQADRMDMSMSEFIERMVEAGRTRIPITTRMEGTERELREQRNELKDELQRARARIDALEDRLYRDELGAVVEYIEENPGCEHDQLISFVGSKAPSLTEHYVNDLRGELIEERADGYYVIERDDAE